MKEQAVVEYWSQVKRIIDKTCEDYDKAWQKRNRVLNSKIVLMMIFKLTSNNRRQGLFINLTEFWNACDEKGIKLPQEKSVTASTFCEARQKISEDIFKDLNRSLLNNWKGQRNLNRWLGLRVLQSTDQELIFQGNSLLLDLKFTMKRADITHKGF